MLGDVGDDDVRWDEYDEEWLLVGPDEEHGEGVRWSSEGATFSFSLRDFSRCQRGCAGCDDCEVQDDAFIHKTY